MKRGGKKKKKTTHTAIPAQLNKVTRIPVQETGIDKVLAKILRQKQMYFTQ